MLNKKSYLSKKLSILANRLDKLGHHDLADMSDDILTKLAGYGFYVEQDEAGNWIRKEPSWDKPYYPVNNLAYDRSGNIVGTFGKTIPGKELPYIARPLAPREKATLFTSPDIGGEYRPELTPEVMEPSVVPPPTRKVAPTEVVEPIDLNLVNNIFKQIIEDNKDKDGERVQTILSRIEENIEHIHKNINTKKPNSTIYNEVLGYLDLPTDTEPSELHDNLKSYIQSMEDLDILEHSGKTSTEEALRSFPKGHETPISKTEVDPKLIEDLGLADIPETTRGESPTTRIRPGQDVTTEETTVPQPINIQEMLSPKARSLPLNNSQWPHAIKYLVDEGEHPTGLNNRAFRFKLDDTSNPEGIYSVEKIPTYGLSKRRDGNTIKIYKQTGWSQRDKRIKSKGFDPKYIQIGSVDIKGKNGEQVVQEIRQVIQSASQSVSASILINLVKLADKLDSLGLAKEADYVDHILKKADIMTDLPNQPDPEELSACQLPNDQAILYISSLINDEEKDIGAMNKIRKYLNFILENQSQIEESFFSGSKSYARSAEEIYFFKNNFRPQSWPDFMVAVHLVRCKPHRKLFEQKEINLPPCNQNNFDILITQLKEIYKADKNAVNEINNNIKTLDDLIHRQNIGVTNFESLLQMNPDYNSDSMRMAWDLFICGVYDLHKTLKPLLKTEKEWLDEREVAEKFVQRLKGNQ